MRNDRSPAPPELEEAKGTPAGPGQTINVELGEKEAEGIYSNIAFITHSSSEFVIDFARMLPGSRKPKVYARIVMTPQHVKSLHTALRENIERYEKAHGAIKAAGKPSPDKGIGF